jgi:RecA/RadA recombinase
MAAPTAIKAREFLASHGAHYSDPSRWLTTGSPYIDAVLGRGFERARLHELFASSGDRKSTLALSVVKYAQHHAYLPVKDQVLNTQQLEYFISKATLNVDHPEKPEIDQQWYALVPDDVEASKRDAWLHINLATRFMDTYKGIYPKIYADVRKAQEESKLEEVEEVPEGKKFKIKYWKGLSPYQFRYVQLRRLNGQEWTAGIGWTVDGALANGRCMLPIYQQPTRVYYFLSEMGGFLTAQAARLGVDLSRLKISEGVAVPHIEALFKEMDKISRQCHLEGREALAIVDSFSFYITETEKYKPEAVGMMGDKGKTTRELWGRHLAEFSERGLTILGISHKSGVGSKVGGVATTFATTTVLHMSIDRDKTGAIIPEAWVLDKSGDPVELKIKFRPVKSRTSQDTHDFETAITYIGDDLWVLHKEWFRFFRDFGILKTAGPFFKFTDHYVQTCGVTDKGFFEKDFEAKYQEYFADGTLDMLQAEYYHQLDQALLTQVTATIKDTPDEFPPGYF